MGVGIEIEAVIFDCDGVLVDSEVLSISGERRALEAFGLRYSPDEYVARFVGMHDRLFFEELRADHLARHGRAAPAGFEDAILEGRRRESHRLTAIAGADEALRAARVAFRGLAVASSSRAHFLKSKLERTGLFDLAAPHVYSADLVAHGKPAPDIFLFAAERLDARPAACLVLEDSVNGVRAARAAGMEVWGFIGGGHAGPAHGRRLADAGAARIVQDFGAFKAALANAAVAS